VTIDDQFLGFKENQWFWFFKIFKNLETIGFGSMSKKNLPNLEGLALS
jgi:hypothetical protein